MAVNHDVTINYVGFVGHMAYFSGAKQVGKKLIHVDFEKYIYGEADFNFFKQIPKT